jgi:enolase-phosphatase E1
MIMAVVLDIEGTTSSLSYFRDTVVPLANQRLPDWFAINQGSEHAEAILAETRRLTGQPDASPEEIANVLVGWARHDVKSAPLKDVQGLVWREALAAGELTAHFYPDVEPALRAWRHRGLRIYVYSSGSVDAQHAWFGHGPDGSLLPYISGNFDIRNAGPKLQASSYRTIADTVGSPASEMLFLSDAPAELDAAAAAGWHTALVQRDSARSPGGRHREIVSFAELTVPEAASSWPVMPASGRS